MVQTRRGLMREKISKDVEGDEASNATDKGSNLAENASNPASNPAENASMPAEKTSIPTEEASIESEKPSICGDEEYNTLLEGRTRVPEAEEREMVPEAIEEEKEEEKDSEEKKEGEDSIPAVEKDIEDRVEGEAVIAAVLDSLRDQEDLRESPEQVASLGEGGKEAETVRVTPEGNSEEESVDKSVSLNSRNTDDEDGENGSGSKYVESSNREEEEGEKLEEEEEEGEQEEEEEQREQEEDESEDREQQVPNDPDEEPAAMAPLMYFPPSEYQKKIKISTRCRIYETVNYLKEGLEEKLNKRELDWFEKHPQFKHIFHMKRDQTHKVMAMWMLLLRTARTDKHKEVWFVVNGVPIRYSLWEHALISGLDCRLYPMNYKDAGSDRFKMKYFKGKKKITIEDVKNELDVMVPDRTDDRLRMAVLYFLCTVMVGQTKNSGKQASGVDKFCLRVVNDLSFCQTFPWGRYSFEYMLRSVSHTMSHFGGVVVGSNHPVPGFCIPLELLPFETIPQLGNEFVEERPHADDNCPRMCRRQFKQSSMTGWPLEKIYAALDTTREINSLITPYLGERDLLQGLMEEGEEDDNYDVAVATWMRRLQRGLTVSFEELYEQDVASRVEQHHEDLEEDDEQPRVDTIELVDLLKDLKDVKKQMENMKEEMQTQMDTMKEEMQSQVDVLQTQVDILQMQLDEQKDPSKATGIASTSHEVGDGSKKKKRERDGKDGKDGSKKKKKERDGKDGKDGSKRKKKERDGKDGSSKKSRK